MDARTAVVELVYRSCLALDARDFEGYLALCHESFRYEVTTYSPEIRRAMTWLGHDKAGMATLFANLPRHNSDASPLTRHATVYTVSEASGEGTREVVSALQVFRTTLDGGATALFAVGKLHDLVIPGDGGPRLLRREVRLDTRLLGFGHHVPF